MAVVIVVAMLGAAAAVVIVRCGGNSGSLVVFVCVVEFVLVVADFVFDVIDDIPNSRVGGSW